MIRRAVLAVLLATAAVAVASTPAQARVCKIDHYCVTTWYEDETYTTVAGVKYEGCIGGVSWGTRTGHVTFEENPC
ncbi:DUF6289 family protein [Nonomuraea sp. NPDC002799]